MENRKPGDYAISELFPADAEIVASVPGGEVLDRGVCAEVDESTMKRLCNPELGVPFECYSTVPGESNDFVEAVRTQAQGSEKKVSVFVQALRWVWEHTFWARVRCIRFRYMLKDLHWHGILFVLGLVIAAMLGSTLQMMSDFDRKLTRFRGDVTTLTEQVGVVSERVYALGWYKDVGEPGLSSRVAGAGFGFPMIPILMPKTEPQGGQ